ncbi:MAG: type VI secretion system-associated FHA domain protein, partial [Pseudomonadota bacterium]
PPPSPDDPEAMVTLLRMRGRAKAPEAAAAAPFPPLTRAVPPPADFAAPLPATSPFPSPPAPLAPSPASEVGEGPFWSLLGLDPTRLSGPERDRALVEVAMLVRALVGGLLDLHATRRRLKAELSLEQTRMFGDENPFRGAGSADDALRRMFAGRAAGQPDPAAQARAVFHELQVHELAASDAMQATITRLMQRISPAAIAFEMEGEAQGTAAFGRRPDKARLWDRYLMMHERLVDALDVLSPELVGQEFARAYAHHVESMRGGESS